MSRHVYQCTAVDQFTPALQKICSMELKLSQQRHHLSIILSRNLFAGPQPRFPALTKEPSLEQEFPYTPGCRSISHSFLPTPVRILLGSYCAPSISEACRRKNVLLAVCRILFEVSSLSSYLLTCNRLLRTLALPCRRRRERGVSTHGDRDF